MAQRTAPTPPSTTIAEFDTYLEAQSVVDRLSDARFPVEHVRIVGTGVTTVEQVTGRMTIARAAGYGALSGLWLGLFIGLIFGLFLVNGWSILLWAAIYGIIWGAIFGAVGHAITGGRRDFASVQGIQAARYGVQVDSEMAAQAQQALSGSTAPSTPPVPESAPAVPAAPSASE